MTILLTVIGIIIVGLILYLASLDGDYVIDRSSVIDAPISDVFNAVVDFKTWPKWSPWLLHEPESKMVYSENYQQPGGYYSWDGKMVGAGKLIHEQFDANRSIQQRIEFIRPFKSISTIKWTFADQDGKTEVHWIMQGKMPFLFRFMTKMTINMVSKDYDLGLLLLNGYLSENAEYPRYNFCGQEQVSPFEYIFQPFKGYVADMARFMHEQLPKLAETAKKHAITDGAPLSIYHHADPVKMYFECDLAIPVSQQPTEPEISVKTLAGGNYYKVECLGDYRFLELAWYKAMCHIKMFKLKINKSLPYLEVYENLPDEVAHSNEVLTTLYIPVK